MRTLRSPDGCPWDREQTLASLRPFVLEETYEVLEAIDSGDPAALCGKSSAISCSRRVPRADRARRPATSPSRDAIDAIGDKLVRRHPHVFGATRRAALVDGGQVRRASGRS